MPAVCRQSDIGGRFLRRGTLGGHEFAQVGWLRLHPSCVSGSVNMSPNNIYRSNAQDCLRMAQAAEDERDKPFWLTLAQSLLRLAEHAAREGGEWEKPGPPVSSGTH